jgi:acetyl esterase
VPLDPETAQLLDLIAPAGGREAAGPASVPDARRYLRTLTVDLADPAHRIPVREVRDLLVPGPAGPLPARIYRPDGGDELPAVVFFHGGGFVVGDLDTHDNQCRTLCARTGAVVCSVAYRLAPEAPFPAAVEDCLAAVRWAVAEPGLGGAAGRLAVAGDSAGGNLAAVTAQRCRDGAGPRLVAQLLLYPATDMRHHPGDAYPSRRGAGQGYLLTLAEMQWFADSYVPAGVDRADPLLSPLCGQLAGLPPAVVATAEFDPLRDEGRAYAAALAAAGVPVTARDVPGMIHGFFGLPGYSRAAAAAVDEICADFAALLRA